MKTNLIAGILISMSLLSCNKNTNFHVKIINPATGEGYANTNFAVVSERTGANGEVVKTEVEGTTNEQGEAVVEVKVKGNKSYYVVPEAIPNICYINDIRKYYNDRTDKNPEFIFEIAPCAQLKLHIQNVNCEGPNDHFKLFYNGRQVGGQDGLIGAVVKDEYGCYTFEQGHWSDVPMGQFYYKWEVTRSTGTTITYDTVTVNQGEQKVYNINY
jgi:hypothetical protein